MALVFRDLIDWLKSLPFADALILLLVLTLAGVLIIILKQRGKIAERFADNLARQNGYVRADEWESWKRTHGNEHKQIREDISDVREDLRQVRGDVQDTRRELLDGFKRLGERIWQVNNKRD